MPEARRGEFVDLYELLEISPRASQDVIQAAYRVLARNYHPDVNATAAAAVRMRQLNAAYNVLSDPQDRARYDLECSRVRRNERVAQANSEASAVTIPAGSKRFRVLPVAPAVPQPHVEEGLPVLSGHAFLGLLAVVAMAGIVLVAVWLALDTSSEYYPVYGGPTVEWSGR
jgi:hypothetical protein